MTKPSCDTCKWWEKSHRLSAKHNADWGRCSKEDDAYCMFVTIDEYLLTLDDFHCAHWEGKNGD